MANCKKCIFYNIDYEKLKNGTNDVIRDDEELTDHHYCRIHEEHIDGYFLHGKMCKYENLNID